MLKFLMPLIKILFQAILPALWEMKEKQHEVIEAESDPVRYNRLSKLKRM